MSLFKFAFLNRQWLCADELIVCFGICPLAPFHKWMTLTKQKLVTLDCCPRSQTAELKRRTMTLLSARPVNYFCSCLTSFSPHLGRNVCCSLLNVHTFLFPQAPAVNFCLETHGKSGTFKQSNKALDSSHNDFDAVSRRSVPSLASVMQSQ